MRRLYIAVSALFLISILLFISAFIYLDKEKRKTYYYIINLDGYDVGAIRIDKFATEDKLIYKSVSSVPFYPTLTDSKSRITLDRRYNLENYSKERSGYGAIESVYLENKANLISFVAIFQSEFASADNIPIRKGAFIFEEDSPVTYLPLVENYDFKKGKSQGFNAITHFSTFLPPMKRFVTLTSIRDEYLKIDSKKIKTEYLWLKIKNYPQGGLWVSKLDRSLVALEMPSRHLKITRTFSPRSFSAKEYVLEGMEYIAKEASFKNKNVQLAGTMTIPQKEGKHPTAILVYGPGPQDRGYQGIFTSVADYLSKNNFCVFRFDKRGIGLSEGDFSSTTDADEIGDLDAALEYTANQKEVDPQKISIIGHSRGAYYASELTSKKDIVRALVLMAPSAYSLKTGVDVEFEDLKEMASKFKWSEDYLKLAIRSNLETKGKIKETKHNWITILGKRCFLKKTREWSDEKPIDAIKKTKVPVLILQGKQDTPLQMESASMWDKALEEGGNSNHTLIYFGYLDYSFGKRVNDGEHRIHYEVDREVLETIKNWLNKNLIETPSQTSQK